MSSILSFTANPKTAFSAFNPVQCIKVWAEFRQDGESAATDSLKLANFPIIDIAIYPVVSQIHNLLYQEDHPKFFTCTLIVSFTPYLMAAVSSWS